MVRVDIWDVQKPDDSVRIDCGFLRDLEDRYTWGKALGKGGFGKVTVVIEQSTGKEYACKSICKHLDIPNLSPQKQAAHLDNIRREIAVLRRLKGTLNVAQFKEALEDGESIHIIMEYCKGGELWNCIGKLQHYSERTVASYMRAVLRTVAQCHHSKILHRDVKPGNFMLLENDPLSPVKAIDFGLAVFFEPSKLPRRDLGLEGTPWFMSPETLSAEVGPPADVWAAGVMAYQLLSGYLPFDDHKSRDAPSLSKIWKAILTEDVSFKGSAWQEVSAEAKDFVCFLLNKDPAQRPTAKDALQHKWVMGGHKEDRNLGAPLRNTVVQRIQRYGQGNVLKRTIFELIAHEIIKMAPDTPDSSNHTANGNPVTTGQSNKRDADSSDHASQRAAQLIGAIKRRKSQRALAVLAQGPGGGAMEGPPLIHRNHHSVHAGMEYFKARGDSVHGGQQALKLSQEGRSSSVHGNSSYWRIMRAAATALRWKSGSVHAHNNYLRYMPRCEDEREELRKAARLALDTSAHASPEYQNILRQCSSPNLRRHGGDVEMRQAEDPMQVDDRRQSEPAASPDALRGQPGGQEGRRGSMDWTASRKVIPATHPPPDSEVEEQQVRGRHAYRQFMEKQGSLSLPSAQQGDIGLGTSNMAQPLMNASASEQLQQAANRPNASARTPEEQQAMSGVHVGLPRTAPPPGDVQRAPARTLSEPAEDDSLGRSAKKQVSFKGMEAKQSGHSTSNGDLTAADHSPRFIGKINISEMKELMRKLNFTREAEGVSEEALAEGLRQLGYQLQPDEMRMLAEQVDPQSASGAISKSAFLASQIDWHSEDLRELWLEAAKNVFAEFEKDSAGKVSSAALMSLVREKVPSAEVEYAVEDALVEAGYADAEEVDFDGFLRILRADSMNSLDHFEARLSQPLPEELAAIAASPPSSMSHSSLLPSVAEES